MSAPTDVCPGHNPANLTNAQVCTAEGWRLLERDEVLPANTVSPELHELQWWCFGFWSNDDPWIGRWTGLDADGAANIYRTRLTRAQLRAARGLPPESQGEAPQPAGPCAQGAILESAERRLAVASTFGFEEEEAPLLEHIRQLVGLAKEKQQAAAAKDARIADLEAKLKNEQIALAHTNDTANTFMGQVRKLQAQLYEVTRERDALFLQLGGLQSCIAEELGTEKTPLDDADARPILRALKTDRERLESERQKQRAVISKLGEENLYLTGDRERLREALAVLAGYASTVRTDRRDETKEYALQTVDWCEGLLEEVTEARKALAPALATEGEA